VIVIVRDGPVRMDHLHQARVVRHDEALPRRGTHQLRGVLPADDAHAVHARGARLIQQHVRALGSHLHQARDDLRLARPQVRGEFRAQHVVRVAEPIRDAHHSEPLFADAGAMGQKGLHVNTRPHPGDGQQRLDVLHRLAEMLGGRRGLRGSRTHGAQVASGRVHDLDGSIALAAHLAGERRPADDVAASRHLQPGICAGDEFGSKPPVGWQVP